MIWARTRPLPTSAAPPGAGASRGPVLRLAAILAVALAHAGLAAVDERALPTAVEVWRWRGSAEVVASGDGVVFVAGDGRLSALDARDGEERWSTALAADALTVAGDVLFVAGDGRFSAVDLARGDVRWSTSVGEKRAFSSLDPEARPLQVGDRLFVPSMEGIAVLDMLDGTLVARIDFGRYLHRLLGPPVVAHVSHGHHTSPRSLLVRFDERSGAELARRELGWIAGIEPVGDRLTVVEGSPWSLGPDGPRDQGPVWAIGLDSQLRILWRRELQGLRGGVLVARSGHRLLVWAVDRPLERHELDPRDGRLTPLPVSWPKGRLPCTGGDGGGPLHLATEDGRAPARVTREGDGGWTIELPAKPRACLQDGEELLLQLPGKGERSLLFVLDAATGGERAVRYLPRQWDRPVAAAGSYRAAATTRATAVSRESSSPSSRGIAATRKGRAFGPRACSSAMTSCTGRPSPHARTSATASAMVRVCSSAGPAW